MRLCDFRSVFALLQNLFYLPADEMRGPTEEINTTYKLNYPWQQTLVIEWGINVDVVLGFEGGKLAYDVRGLPEDGAEEVESAGDADKAQRYRQPLYLRVGFGQLF